MKNSIYFLVLVVLFTSSCVKDIGEQVRVSITVAPFNRLKQDAATDIVLSQGSGYSIDFEGSDIVLGDLDFKVIDGELIVSQYGHYKYSGKSTIYITVPILYSIENTSSGDIYGDNRFNIKGKIDLALISNGGIDLNIDAHELNTYIRGSGTMRLTGYSDYHEIDHEGFGNLYSFGLQTDKIRIITSSSGNSEINVRNNLFVRLRGSGNISFIGNPYVDFSVTGFGRLIDAN